MCWIESLFPNLSPDNYRLTSPETRVYNSIAWALEEDDRYWWPDPLGQYYWPNNVPREETLTAFTEVYLMFGYEICTSRELEQGFEKVALYVGEDGKPSHATRQLSTGMWSSKIEDVEDIEHDTLECLERGILGSVGRILKRSV